MDNISQSIIFEIWFLGQGHHDHLEKDGSHMHVEKDDDV